MSKFVRYAVSSHLNISFDHVIAEISVDDFLSPGENWDDLSPDEQDNRMYERDIVDEIVYNSVEITAEVVDE